MKHAIADSSTAVNANQVTVTSILCADGVRLLHGVGSINFNAGADLSEEASLARRLSKSLIVDYEIVVAGGGTVPTQTDLSPVTLKDAANARLLEQGVVGVTASSVQINTFTTRTVLISPTTTNTQPTDRTVSSTSRHHAPYRVFAAFVVVGLATCLCLDQTV